MKLILYKRAMPHVLVDDKGADLFLEFLESPDRHEFFDDLTSSDQPTIKLPDFGRVKNFDISNPSVKEITEKDLTESDEDLIKRFVQDKKEPKYPFLEYDDIKHRYKLKPKYDIEKMLKDVLKKNKS